MIFGARTTRKRFGQASEIAVDSIPIINLKGHSWNAVHKRHNPPVIADNRRVRIRVKADLRLRPTLAVPQKNVARFIIRDEPPVRTDVDWGTDPRSGGQHNIALALAVIQMDSGVSG